MIKPGMHWKQIGNAMVPAGFSGPFRCIPLNGNLNGTLGWLRIKQVDERFLIIIKFFFSLFTFKHKFRIIFNVGKLVTSIHKSVRIALACI